METKDTYTKKLKAPLMPDYFKSQDNVVYTFNSSIDVFNETLMICSQMNGSIVKKSASPLKFNIKAIFKNQIDLYVPVVINFLFFTVPFDELELTAICIQNISEDCFEFKSILKQIIERIQASNTKFSGKPAPKKLKIEAEEALSDVVDLI